MARLLLHADEAGNFDFSRSPGASKYFILTTVATQDHSCGDDLLDLRRRLGWEGTALAGEFHATTDAQAIRDQVYGVISAHAFRIDATILDKAKAYPSTHTSDERFYKRAWYYHIKHVVPVLAAPSDEIMLIAASIGIKRKRQAFFAAVREVMEQVSPENAIRTAFWPSCVDPCLQVADYCAWAIQRKWESGDSRSYDLIRHRIGSEYDLFGSSPKVFY